MNPVKSINVAPYRKAVAAVVAGVTVIASAVGEAVADGSIDATDVVQIVAAVGGVFGVYFLPNDDA